MGEKEGKSPTEVITAFHRCTGRSFGSYYSGPEYFGIQNKRIQKKLAKRYAQASRTERVRDKRRHAAQERKAKLAKKKEEEKEEKPISSKIGAKDMHMSLPTCIKSKCQRSIRVPHNCPSLHRLRMLRTRTRALFGHWWWLS